MKNEANLLVIGNIYRNFIKETVEEYNKHFKKIHVFVKYNPVGELSNLIPFDCTLKDYLHTNTKKHLITLDNKPDNVEVSTAPLLFLPTVKGYKKVGEKLFNYIDRQIENNNIKVDLIHAHFVWPAGFAAAKLKEKYKVPFVVTAHGYDIYDLPFRDEEWRGKIKYVLDAADYIITVSKSNLKCINELDVKRPVEVIPNGFSKDLFFARDITECRDKLNLPRDKNIILTVGSLLEVKGHKFLIEAMVTVIKKYKNVLCVIVGGGVLRDKLEKQVSNMGLSDFILFAGEKKHGEIPLWMNACDIFVLPSLNEGNPTVMFECLSCGKPFVGTEVGGIPEVIISGDYGLLCKPGEPLELARQLSAALGIIWDNKSIKDYAEQYTWKNIARKHVNIYEEVLGG